MSKAFLIKVFLVTAILVGCSGDRGYRLVVGGSHSFNNDSGQYTLVNYWAEWCQPCKMLTPTVEELAGEFEGQVLVGKLNVDDNPNTATNYGIRGIPTLLFIKDGQVVQQLVGVKSKAEIKKVIEETLT